MSFLGISYLLYQGWFSAIVSNEDISLLSSLTYLTLTVPLDDSPKV